MISEESVDLQQQIRENSQDLQNYLIELVQWEKEMKKKDSEIREKRSFEDSGGAAAAQPQENNSDWVIKKEQRLPENRKRIDPVKKHALDMKNIGNKYFRENKYDTAIQYYNLGIKKDPDNPALFANRALAYMKVGKVELAEDDLSTSVILDPTYVKAYFRRGVARKQLKKFDDAEKDFGKVLEFEPQNKQALLELNKVKQEKSKCATVSYRHQKQKGETEPPIFFKQVTSKSQCNAPLMSQCDASFEQEQAAESFDPGPECLAAGDTCADSRVISCIEKPPHLQSTKPLVPVEVKIVNKNVQALSTLTCDDDDRLSDNEPEDNDGTVTNDITVHISAKKQSTSILEMEPVLPPVPKKSYQFAIDWRRLNGYPELQYKYLKQFPPEKFPDMFACSMDSELFEEILKILSVYLMLFGEDVYKYLLYLSKIGRFQTLMMMMFDEEANYVKGILKYIRSCDDYTEEQKSSICELYKL